MIAFFAVKLMDCSKQNISLSTLFIICAMGMRGPSFFYSVAILITAMISVICEPTCDQNGRNKVRTQRRLAVKDQVNEGAWMTIQGC